MPWTMTRQQIPNPTYIPWTTGRFYQSPFNRAVTTAAASLTNLNIAPIYVPNASGVTIATLGLEVTGGGTTSTMRLGIYGVTATGLPSGLLYDGGSQATTGTGFLSVSPNLVLRQGWYFVASIHTGGAAPTVRVMAGPWGVPLGNTAPNGFTLNVSYSASGLPSGAAADIVANGLPGSYPLVAAVVSQNNVPRVLVGI